MKTMMLTMTAIAMCSTAAIAGDMSSKDKAQMKMMIEHCMKKMDTDGDGMVSKAEHTAGADMMFSESDTNKDGKISKDEAMAYNEAQMKEAMHK